jgi:alkanesulfonate monooxygenase SsuD/methylene tetrahydromethanopterin reductase-like flavin-dependent oxidoreductase (luciferase family)
VDVGLFLPQVAMAADEIERRARHAEDVGLHSLWLIDHLVAPGQPELPILEGFTLATHLLARTSRLRIGHLVLCASFRHPALLAKMAATVDVLSGGRLELALGSGSSAEEHRRAGLPWDDVATRTERLEETVATLADLLSAPPATYAGHHIQLDALPNEPGPRQRPRPPIHVGGVAPRTLDVVARHADGWNLPAYALEHWRAHHEALDRACHAAGRDPASLLRSHQALVVLGHDTEAVDAALSVARRRYGAPGWGLAHAYVGTPTQVADQLAETADAGVDLVMLLPHDRGHPATLDLLGDQVLPRLR